MREAHTQLIAQRATYINHSKGFFEFPVQLRSIEELQRSFLSVELLLKEALRDPQGPVHVNLPLAEPLYVPLPDPVLTMQKNTPSSGDQEPGGELSLPQWEAEDPRILILAGMGRGSKEVRNAL